MPLEEDRASCCFLVVHSTLDTADLTRAIRRAFNGVFPGAALPASRRAIALDEMVGRSIAGLRFNATLVGAFSALAMILAVIGLFGLVAYSVSQRRRELALRLGARPANLVATTQISELFSAAIRTSIELLNNHTFITGGECIHAGRRKRGRTMRWTHEPQGKIRGIVAVIITIVLFPRGDLVATLQAATPAQSTYRSTGSADPDEARRIVMNLGVGQHVMVTLSSGETVRGQIRGIADDHFVLLPEGSAAPADIAYGDVRQLGPIRLQPVPRSRASNKRQLIAVVLVVILAIVSYTVQGCGETSAC